MQYQTTMRTFITGSLFGMVVVCLPLEIRAAKEPSQLGLEVQSVVLHLIDQAEVPAQEAGVLVNLGVREGTPVKKGQLLALVDDRQARRELSAATVELASAKEKAESDIDLRHATNAHEVAKAALARSESAIRQYPKSVSQTQLDLERLSVKKTELEQEQARHEAVLGKYQVELQKHAMEVAKVELARRRITSPLDGLVVETFVRRGEWVQPGEKAVRVVAVDRLKAEGFVSASEIEQTKQGSSVRLVTGSESGPEREFQGKVIFVSPEIDPITRQVRISAEIENAAHFLRPGQRVQMWVTGGQ